MDERGVVGLAGLVYCTFAIMASGIARLSHNIVAYTIELLVGLSLGVSCDYTMS